MLSLIAQGKYTSTIGHDKCQTFIRWLRQQDLTNDGQANSEQKVQTPKPSVLALPASTPNKNFKPRITFSQNEIDNLTEWFNEDERPSKEEINQYTDILNIPRQMASIRLLTPDSIYFWFKNKRSKKKKEESSLLEPWEKENVVLEGGDTPQLTMAVGETSQAIVTTAGVPAIESTSQLVAGSTMMPHVTMETKENGGASISMAITKKSSGEICIPDNNSLATMLARYSSPHGYGTSPTKPRKLPKSRVTFDPQTELNVLNKWFDDNERPDKEIMEEYTNILNQERSQKSKRPLTLDSIAMWFKNRRAKRRRSEGNLTHSEEDGGQTIEDNENLGQANTTDTDTAMDITTATTTATDSPSSATVEIAVTSIADAKNGGAVSSQEANDNNERNVFNAGLVAVKTATV